MGRCARISRVKLLLSIAVVLALAGPSPANAEVLTLTCNGGPRPVHLRLDSEGEVVVDGVPQRHRAYSFVWHADVVSFRLEMREAGVIRPATISQEWTINRDTGATRTILRGRTTAYSSYDCRDSATGERRF